MALCGILGALAVALLMLGGAIPLAIYCCPILASLLLVPLQEVVTRKLCIVWYITVSVLSLLLTADKETAIVFVFLGWYPIVREALETLPKGIRLPVKLLMFNAAVAAMYALMIYVLHMEAIASELQSASLLLLLTMLVLGNIVFIVLDVLLRHMRVYFHNKIGRM